MEWEASISKCFSGSDPMFANCSSDEEWAFNLLIALRQGHVPWREVMAAFARYLLTRGCAAPHIDDQLTRIEKFYSPWLE